GLAGARVGDDGARALAASTRLAWLTSLDVSDNQIGPEGALALRGCKPITWPVAAHSAGAAGVAGGELAKSYLYSSLANRPRCRASPRSSSPTTRSASEAPALAASPHLAGLAALALAATELGPEGASAIAASPYLARLASLDLSANRVGAH